MQVWISLFLLRLLFVLLFVILLFVLLLVFEFVLFVLLFVILFIGYDWIIILLPVIELDLKDSSATFLLLNLP